MNKVTDDPDEGNARGLAQREPDAPTTDPHPRARVVTFLEYEAEMWILAAVKAHAAAILATPRGWIPARDEVVAPDLATAIDALTGSGAHLARTILEHMERPASYAPGAPLDPLFAQDIAHAAMFATGRASTLANVEFKARFSRTIPAAEVLAALPYVAALAPPPPPARGRTLEHLAGFACESMGSPCAPLAVILRARRWCGFAPVPPWEFGGPLSKVPDSESYLTDPGARWITDTLRAFLKRARGAAMRGARPEAAASIASLALRALGHDPRPFGGASRRATSRGYDIANPDRPRQSNGRGPKLLP